MNFPVYVTEYSQIARDKFLKYYTLLTFSNSTSNLREGAVPQLRRLVAGFPPRRHGFEPRSSHVVHVGFVVDQVVVGQAFCEYFDFLWQFSFHRLLHIHDHLSSGAGTTGQLVADVPSGLSLTPSQETKKKTSRVNITCSLLYTYFLKILYDLTSRRIASINYESK
jgi:hypothetical protein